MPRHDTPVVFTVTTDGGAGLTRRQTQGTSFRTPAPGVRVRADASLTHDVAIAIALAGQPPGSVLTDLSAAWLWRLPLPPWLRDGPATVSVSRLPDDSRSRRAGVQGRRLDLPPEHLTTLDGVLLTTAPRTWLDGAAHLPTRHVVAMGDALLRRGLGTPEELKGLCHWAFRRRGVVTARTALPLLDAHAESPGESLARYELVTRGIPAPECNADIVVDGQWLARADMLWRDARVIVEYDGHVHISEEQRQYDAVRRNQLQEEGYLVIVLTARDLRYPEQMAQTVWTALRSRLPR